LPAKSKYTEEELIRLIREGNSTAFSYLYKNYSRAIFGIISSIIDNKNEAEDVLQNVFVKIWNNFPAYDPNKGRLYTWMLNIARNMAIDFVRSRHAKMETQIHKIENNVYEINRQHQHNIDCDHIGLKDVVDNLKEDQKKLIKMAYFGGYTQEEMAEELQMPLGTVKTKIRSALLTLRELMSK
jgi:RNA polymerase sigma-70 factor (ECF subfamily)